MKRITETQKKIINAHLVAFSKNEWSFHVPRTKEELIEGIKGGAVYEALHEEIATRYVSITSQLYASPNVFNHVTEAYRKQYTAGFKELLNNLNIQ